MKRIYIVLLLLSLLSLFSCRTKEVIRYVDRVHNEQVILRDTVIDVQLVRHKDSVSIKDTASHLENKYAYSNASFQKGHLSHSLAIKDVDIPVKIEYKEKIVTDSIPYPVVVKSDPVIVYKRGIFWWIGLGSVVFLLLFIVYKLRR